MERNLQLDNRLLDRYLLIQDHRHGEIPGGPIWIEVERRSDTCITFCIQGASVSAIPGAMLTPRRCRATREEWILEFVIFLALKSEYVEIMNVLDAKKLAVKVLKQTMDSTTLLPEKFEMCEIVSSQTQESPVHFQMVPLCELVNLCNETS